MTTLGNHAVVIGAGVGGLVAARVLSEFYTRVTIIERDTLPADPVPRKCVPQGRHAHALLARGADAFDELFPGFTAGLVARGAPTGDVGRKVRWTLGGHRHAPSDSGVRGVGASRPLIEWQLGERVRELPNVSVASSCTAVDLTGDQSGRRVTGVTVRQRSRYVAVDADLVLDASGRSSQTQPWLESFGCPRPTEDRLSIGIAYATRHFRREPDQLGGANAVVVGATPELPRGGVILANENDTWVATVSGYAHDEPPVDPDGFAAFASSLPAPEFGALVAEAEPLDEPMRYRIPTTVRRRYEAIPLPESYVPFADAICCFNPVYGQGMSVAAAEALILRRCLIRGAETLAPRFLHRIRQVEGDTWTMTSDSDLVMPCVEGRRSGRTRISNAYAARMHRAAATDPEVGKQFLRVVNLLDRPSALLRPANAARVLRANLRPEPTVPAAAPPVRRGADLSA